MTVQNRIALDMLLAEKGGVCRIIGSNCCTFIPNNTAQGLEIFKRGRCGGKQYDFVNHLIIVNHLIQIFMLNMFKLIICLFL